MNRRQLIQSLAVVTGHAMFPTVLSSFLTGCANHDMSNYKPVFFTESEYKSIIPIIDIIIPATKTKSASQVNTQVFLDFTIVFKEEGRAYIYTNTLSSSEAKSAARCELLASETSPDTIHFRTPLLQWPSPHLSSPP